MATQLTLVNNLLRRLREDTVSSVADNAYSQLLAMFVNDGIREVSESYDWASLLHTINVDVVDGTSEYDLSKLVSAGGHVDNSDRVTTADSMLRVSPSGKALCFLYEDSSASQPTVQLQLITEDERMRKYQNDRSDASADPSCFSLIHATTGDGWLLRLSPEPDASRRLRITFSTPQAELAIDGTDDATEIVVPNAVVEAYAHMATANERGEEIGEPGNLLERRWQRVLGGAIEAAMSADVQANRYEFWRE